MKTDPSPWLDALAGSHDRLCELVGELGGEGLRRSSYCDGWSVAQVLSHLGSGAEIFKGVLDATVNGDPPPSRDSFPAVWERWNAMTPEEQAERFLATDGELVQSLENLGDGLDELEFALFGAMVVDAVGFLGVRLSEHAVHTWDVAVSLDPTATIEPDAALLLVDRLPDVAQRGGKAEGAEGAGADAPLTVRIEATEPPRRFLLRVDDAVHLEPLDEKAKDAGGDADAATELHLPAEALIRLLYGRLDPDHTPVLDPSEAATVDVLRKVFPGF